MGYNHRLVRLVCCVFPVSRNRGFRGGAWRGRSGARTAAHPFLCRTIFGHRLLAQAADVGLASRRGQLQHIVLGKPHLRLARAALSGDARVIGSELCTTSRSSGRITQSRPFIVRSTDGGRACSPSETDLAMPTIVVKQAGCHFDRDPVSKDGDTTSCSIPGVRFRRISPSWRAPMLGAVDDSPSDSDAALQRAAPPSRFDLPILRIPPARRRSTCTKAILEHGERPRKNPPPFFLARVISCSCRENSTPRPGKVGRHFMLSQHLYRHRPGGGFEAVAFETQSTNLRGNLKRGVWAHDTPGLSLNPVTGRIELLDSHRHGGGPDDAGPRQDAGKSSLNLWSIALRRPARGQCRVALEARY